MRKHKYAYKKVRIPGGETIEEHRLVMQNHIGRKLDRYEVVHHKDGNKKNNCIDNLELMSLSEHTRHHNLGIVHSESTRNKLREKNSSHCPTRNLNLLQAIRVFNLLKAGSKQKDIAELFNVTGATISRLATRKSWAFALDRLKL